jgi:hypothetical protein
MTNTTFLYKACKELFTSYPLAVRAINGSGTIRSMVLLLRNGDNAEFFLLLHNCTEGKPFYSLCPWHGGSITDIDDDDSVAMTDGVANVLTHGVPIPQHGSLFGWRFEDFVTNLIAISAEDTPACLEPSWTVMPLAETPETQWPPFIEEHFFGRWFWEHYWAGSIVSLADLISRIPNAVFWVDTEEIIGWDCCAVARDIRSPEGYTLRRGRYVYYQTLRSGEPVPSLEILLRNARKVDLAPRFRKSLDHSHCGRTIATVTRPHSLL